MAADALEVSMQRIIFTIVCLLPANFFVKMFSRIDQGATRLAITARATTGRRFFGSSAGNSSEAMWRGARLTGIVLGSFALGVKILSDKEKAYRASVQEELASANVAHSAASKLPAEGLPGTNYERTFIASK